MLRVKFTDGAVVEYPGADGYEPTSGGVVRILAEGETIAQFSSQEVAAIELVASGDAKAVMGVDRRQS